MATLNPAAYHGLNHLGAIAPGRRADILFLDDLVSFVPERVLKRGRPVGRDRGGRGPGLGPAHGARRAGSKLAQFAVPWRGGKARVIGLVPDQIITASLEDELTVVDGFAVADPARDLAKIAVFERHLQTGRVGLGFVRGFGLERGALGSTVAHDAHNLIVVGADDASMLTAAERLRELGGGLVVAEGDRVLAELPLPVAGLLSDRPLAEVLAASRELGAAVRALGITFPQPVQMLAFLSLSVIPALKITDRGLVDVERFELVPLEGLDRPERVLGDSARRRRGRRGRRHGCRARACSRLPRGCRRRGRSPPSGPSSAAAPPCAAVLASSPAGLISISTPSSSGSVWTISAPTPSPRSSSTGWARTSCSVVVMVVRVVVVMVVGMAVETSLLLPGRRRGAPPPASLRGLVRRRACRTRRRAFPRTGTRAGSGPGRA